MRTITRQRGGTIGAKLGPKLVPFNLSIGANVDRFISRQFKIRQTAYVATNKVINGIRKDKIRNIDDIREGMVIECDVFLENLRKIPDDEQVKPGSWRAKRQEDKDPRIQYARQYGRRQDMAVEALSIKKDGAYAVLILALSPQWLLRPDDDEFSRRATLVGKVVGVQRDGERAREVGDGKIDFKTAVDGPAALAASPASSAVSNRREDPDSGHDEAGADSDPPDEQGGGGWRFWKRRRSSKYARKVAAGSILRPDKPDTGGSDL